MWKHAPAPAHGGRRPKLRTKKRERLAEMLADGAEAHGFQNVGWTPDHMATLIEEKSEMYPGNVYNILEHPVFS